MLRTSRPSQNNLYHHELSYGISKIRFAGHRLIQIYFQLALAMAMLLSISSLSRFNASSPAARRSAISTFSLAASSPLIEIDHYGERLIRLHRVQSLGVGSEREQRASAPRERSAQVLCSTGNTRDAFSVVVWTRAAPSLGRVPLQMGGSDDLHVYDLSHGPIGCHGTLRSAGNASWPLYCRARQC